jgi:RimJ/RimL family protein N-acetyltransferase
MLACLEEIATRRCRIAALRVEDAARLQAITDASVTTWVHFLSEPFTLDDARALIAHRDDGHRFLGVWNEARSQLFGVIGIAPRRMPQNIEIGYWFAAAARGRGLATEAVEAVVAALLRRCPSHQIVAECRFDNKRSRRLLARTGFRPTGEPGERPGRILLRWDAHFKARIDVC